MPAARRQPPPAARHPERRGVLRHPVQLSGTLSTGDGVPRPVTLLDISERGCRIVRPDGLGSDTVLTLAFGGFTPFEAQVAWTTAAAAGLRFEQPIHPALVRQVVAAAKGRRRGRGLAPELVRREERERLWHLQRPVTGQLDGTPFAGTLVDLSAEGCRVATGTAARSGAEAELVLADQLSLAGEVRWCDAGAIGVRFPVPLLPVTVRLIAKG